MKPDNYFNLRRFALLLRNDLATNYKLYLRALAVIMGFLIFLAFVMVTGNQNPDSDWKSFHKIWFSITLQLSGLFMSARAFYQLNTPQQRHLYLSLPASTLEKYISKWLPTAVFFPIVFTLAYWLTAQIIGLIRTPDFAFEVFSPFEESNWLNLKIYFVVQSVFLFGSIAFNQYAFFKTAFGLLIVGAGLLLINYVVFRVAYWDYLEGFGTPNEYAQTMRVSEEYTQTVDGPIWSTVQNLFWFLLAPVFWVAGYFRLKEREV